MSRVLVAAITLASTAALVTAATVTPARASQPRASQPRASQWPGASRDRRARQERFRIISTSAGARRQSVLATGAFTAGGYQVSGRVTGLRSTDKMVFPGGTFLMARRITRQWLPLPTGACLVRETIHGTYSLGRGTGSYARISGSGAFALRIRGVIRRRHGKCGGPLTVYQQITYAGGAIRG